MPTSHATCEHAATPEVRRACRTVRQFTALAEKHGLFVETCDLGDGPRYVVWAQYRVRNPRRSWSTELLITVSRNTPWFSVHHPGQQSKRVSLREARIWLAIIKI